MVKSFNIPDDKVAKYAGLMSAIFSLSQCLTGIAWGRASDKWGRKPMIVGALTCTMISSVLFGFSRSLIWAFVARSLQGLSNGNVGIIRTAVAELVPEKELQPRAFSLMPLVWTVGSIFGPAFGGSLVHPVERFPKLFGGSQLLKDYPFALPNILISLLFVLGITQGILFLHETLEEKKNRRDYGLLLGSLLTRSCRRRQPPIRFRGSEEDAPFLGGEGSEMSRTPTGTTPSKPAVKAGWAQVFTRQSNINLGVYTLLAMHSVAYDQLLPIYMNYPVQSIRDPAVRLPLKFAGGFGIDSARIGLWFMFYGIYGMVIQFAVFPWCARKYGVLNCLKACSIVFPFVYVATPFTALLPTSQLQQGVNFCLMMVKGFCSIFSFPCSTILLTNSASSLKILGTLNGVATSISAIGRAAGPALAGIAFTGGVDIGYVITSWWQLAATAVIASIPIWWLEEMEGFGSRDDGEESDEEAEEAVKATSIEAESGRQRKSSLAVATDGVFDYPDDDAEDSALLSNVRTGSTDALPRRESLALIRTRSPIGLGPGIGGERARRFSSELGATRSGLGTGGTTYH